MVLFQKTPQPSGETAASSPREATAMSRAPMRNRRPWLRCTGSSPGGDGALKSHAGSSRARSSNRFGARGIFPRQIHLHPPFPRSIPISALSSPIWVHPRCRRWLQLGGRRPRHRRLWMRRRWHPQPIPSVAGYLNSI